MTYDQAINDCLAFWDFSPSTVAGANVAPAAGSEGVTLTHYENPSTASALSVSSLMLPAESGFPSQIQAVRLRRLPQNHLRSAPAGLALTSFSVGMWLLPTTSGSGNWGLYHLDNTATTTPQLQLRLAEQAAAQGVMSVYSRNDGGGVWVNDLTTGPTGLRNANVWMHLGWQLQPGLVTYYKDGLKVGQVARSGAGGTFNRLSIGHATSAATPDAYLTHLIVTQATGDDLWQALAAGPPAGGERSQFDYLPEYPREVARPPFRTR